MTTHEDRNRRIAGIAETLGAATLPALLLITAGLLVWWLS